MYTGKPTNESTNTNRNSFVGRNRRFKDHEFVLHYSVCGEGIKVVDEVNLYSHKLDVSTALKRC